MYGPTSVRYRAAPLDALAGTRTTKWVAPTPVANFTVTAGGATQVMRFEFSDDGLLDQSTAYLACTFQVQAPDAVAAVAATVAPTDLSTSGGVICPSSVESLIAQFESQVMGQSVDFIQNYSQLQSMYNALYGPGYAKTFGKVMGIGAKDERLIGFTRTAGELQTTGWQNRELLIPLSGTSLFGNPSSGLVPMRFMTANGNPLRLQITLADPLTVFGISRPVDADGVPGGTAPTGLSYSLSNVRLYYDSLSIDSTVEKWMARLSAGIPLPYPIKRVFNQATVLRVGEQNPTYNFALSGNDIRAVVFAFQCNSRRPASVADMVTVGKQGVCWTDESVFPQHNSAYANGPVAFNSRNPNGGGAGVPTYVGPDRPHLVGLTQAQLFVNQQPFPAYGPFQMNPSTLIPSAAMPYVELSKIAGVIGERESVGLDVDYRRFIDNSYAIAKRYPRGVGVAYVGAADVSTAIPVGDVGEVKLTADSPSFYLAFNLSTDPDNDDMAAGLGTQPTQSNKQCQLTLTFNQPIGVWDANTNPFGGDITVQCYAIRHSTMLLYQSSAVITDQIVATASE